MHSASADFLSCSWLSVPSLLGACKDPGPASFCFMEVAIGPDQVLAIFQPHHSPSCRSFPAVSYSCALTTMLLSALRSSCSPASASNQPHGCSGGHASHPTMSFWVCRCVLTKNYNAALPILRHPAYDVDPELSGMTAKDFLLYAYYGGLIYIGAASSWLCQQQLADVHALLAAQSFQKAAVLARCYVYDVTRFMKACSPFNPSHAESLTLSSIIWMILVRVHF